MPVDFPHLPLKEVTGRQVVDTQLNLSLLADRDQRRREQLWAKDTHPLDWAAYLHHFQGIPGGDVVGVYHIKTELSRSGRRTDYYDASLFDVMGKKCFGAPIALLLEAKKMELASQARASLKPLNPSAFLLHSLTSIYQFFTDSGHVHEDHDLFAEGTLGVLAVSHGGKKPTSVKYYFVQTGGESEVFHDPESPDLRATFLNPEHKGAHKTPPLLTFPPEPSLRPKVVTLPPGKSLILFSDGFPVFLSGGHFSYHDSMIHIASEWDGRRAKDIVRTVAHGVEKRPELLHDDVSMLVLRHAKT